MTTIIFQGITPAELINQIDSIIQMRIKEQTSLLRKSKLSEKEYLTGKEVQEVLSISAPTRYEWERKGLFNRYKVSGRARYKRTEIIDALIKIEKKRAK